MNDAGDGAEQHDSTRLKSDLSSGSADCGCDLTAGES